MKVLVINAGSSSLKYQLLDPETGLPLNYSDDTNAYEEEHEYATVEEAV